MADLVCRSSLANSIRHRSRLIGINSYFELELGNKVHRVFCPSINFTLTLLTAIAFNLCDGEALNTQSGQRFAYFIQFERFDDCHDKLHVLVPYLQTELISAFHKINRS